MHRVLAVVLLLAVVASGAAADPAEDVPVLWLDRPLIQGPHILSAFGPEPNATTHQIQPVQTQLHANQLWRAKIPAPWTMNAGDEATALVFLTGIDQLLPLPDPQPDRLDPVGTMLAYDPDAAGKIIIEGRLLEGGDSTLVLAAGHTYHVPDPTADASTVYSFLLRMPYIGASLGTDPEYPAGVAFDLYISGRTVTNISPIRIHIGSNEAPAHLTLPGFPMDAYRAIEAEKRGDIRCNELILMGQPCHIIEPTGGRYVETGESSATTGPVVVVMLGATVVAGAALLRVRGGDLKGRNPRRT